MEDKQELEKGEKGEERQMEKESTERGTTCPVQLKLC